MSKQELLRNYRSGDLCSTAALIKAEILVETEATKMLTAQLNDTSLTNNERFQTFRKIERAGYVIAQTGNMKNERVFEERV